MAQHQVRVIVNQRKGPFSEYLDAAIEVVCLDELGLKIPKLQVLIRMLVYTFKVVQPDSVSISYAPIMNLTALVAKLFRGNRIIIQEHALLSAALKDHYAHGLGLRLVYRWVFLPAYRYADRFLAISRAIRDDLVDNFTITLNASSYKTVLQNRIAGRKTNGESWKAYYPSDTSMDNVYSLADQYFDFGAKPKQGASTQSTASATIAQGAQNSSRGAV
jgi:hypothetical protein